MLNETRILKIGSLCITNGLLLAPMEGYTDQPFRRICRRLGADLVYTEFTSSEGLVRMAGRTARKISLAEDERPAGVQIFGRDPERMADAARRLIEGEPDIVDINFGCPVRKVTGGGAGSQLMRDPERLLAIARAVREAVDIPVTAKLRLGWDHDSINVVEICQRLQDIGIEAVAIHGRTRCQKYTGLADWDWIARVREALEIPVIGNGDVLTPQDAQRMFEHTGCHAVMIGRGVMHNPWLFARCRAWLDEGRDLPLPDISDRVRVCLEHLSLAVEHKGELRAVLEMRKMYPGYLREVPGMRQLRAELVTLTTEASVRERLEHYLEQLAQNPDPQLPPSENQHG